MCHFYGYQRVKWNIARGFRYQVLDQTQTSQPQREWTLERKAGGSEWEQARYTVKVSEESGKAECECPEFKNTGFPCSHICLLNYKGIIQEMEIHKRWHRVQKSALQAKSSAFQRQADTVEKEDAQKDAEAQEINEDDDSEVKEVTETENPERKPQAEDNEETE